LPTLYQVRLPPPADWQELQRMTSDLYKRLWSNEDIQEFGSIGQRQNGVDVFALQADGNVYAIRADGTTAWTASVGTNSTAVPDFQGGLVVTDWQSIWKLDGTTGQAYPSYASVSGNGVSTPVIHTDGTIFALDGNAVVGIDPLTGQQKFSVPLPLDTDNQTEGGSVEPYGCWDSPMPQGSSNSTSSPTTIGSLIIAGDGYAYLPVFYTESTTNHNDWCVWQTRTTAHLDILRVGTGGDAYTIEVKQWTYNYSRVQYTELGPDSYVYGPTIQTAPIPKVSLANPTTNADTGVLISWEEDTPAWCAYQAESETGQPITTGCEDAATTFNLATTEGTSLASTSPISLPGQVTPVQPIVQREDGSYVGTVWASYTNMMIAFTPSGTVLWTEPGDTPQIATADGGVIGTSGITYDQNGVATGMLATLPTYSWLGYAYQDGPLNQVAALAVNFAPSFLAMLGGNNSANGTAVKQTWFPRLTSCHDPGTNVTCPGPKEVAESALTALRAFVPTCQNCASKVFVPLGGINEQARFSKWIGRAGLFDGTKSNFPMFLLCLPITGTNQCYGEGRDILSTVSDKMASGGTSNLSMTPSPLGLITFYDPFYLKGHCAVTSNQPSDFWHQSVLFHEGLHGFYGQFNDDIQKALGIQVGTDSINITRYIYNNAFGITGAGNCSK